MITIASFDSQNGPQLIQLLNAAITQETIMFNGAQAVVEITPSMTPDELKTLTAKSPTCWVDRRNPPRSL
jgi:hypothetical protein